MSDKSKIAVELELINGQYLAKLKESKGKTKGFTNDLQSAFGKIGAGLAVFGGATALKNFTEYAGRIDSISDSYYNLARSYEENGDTMVAAISEAAKGTISNLDIMKSATSAMNLMGEDVIQYLPEMAEVAKAAAKATGEEVSQMFSDLITASGRQSVQILDNLGISSATASRYMDEYAKSLGKTRNQLNDTEKSQAFFFATMKAGKEIVARVGGETLSLGELLQIMKNRATNAADGFTQHLTPGIKDFLTAVIGANDGKEIQSFSEGLGKYFSSQLSKAAWYINNLVKGFNLLMGYMAKLKAQNLHEDIARINKALKNQTKITKEQAAEYQAIIDGFKESRQAAIDYFEAAKEAGDRNKEILAGNQETIAQQKEVIDHAKTTVEEIDYLTQAAIAEAQRIAAVYTQAYASMTNDMKGAFESAFSSIDTANRDLVYDIIWGEGGWDEWRDNMKQILKDFVADIIYATAKALALKAIIAGLGISTGAGGAFAGGFAAGFLGSIFKKGYNPPKHAFVMPIAAEGIVPSNHFPAWIGDDEFVINAQSSRKNYSALSAMNNNPGAEINTGSQVVLELTNVIPLDGKEIYKNTEKYIIKNGKLMGGKLYSTGSAY